MSTYQDLKLVEGTYDRQIATFRAQPANARDIDYFQKNIGKVKSADDLMKDYRLYSFVMRAFGLESQIYARALMKKVMSEGVTDPKSTANRMNDPRFKELATTL